MDNLISCEYNMDTGCVELWFLDGSRITIDCTAVEKAYADNLYERSELDYLMESLINQWFWAADNSILP